MNKFFFGDIYKVVFKVKLLCPMNTDSPHLITATISAVSFWQSNHHKSLTQLFYLFNSQTCIHNAAFKLFFFFDCKFRRFTKIQASLPYFSDQFPNFLLICFSWTYSFSAISVRDSTSRAPSVNDCEILNG